MSEYQDISTLPNNPEPVDGAMLETSDYSEFEIAPIGHYTSQSRSIKVKTKEDGTLSFEINFDGGVVNDSNGKTYGKGRYPFRTWVSNKKFQQTNRPGLTSTAAQYLRACGLNPKSITDLKEAMIESQNLTVGLYITWEDKGKKTGVIDPVTNKEKWEQKGLKGKDFNIGTADAPVYSPTITIDGETFTARPKVSGFNRLRA